MPDTMTLKLLSDIIDGQNQLVKLVVDHQAYVLALHGYLEAQPGYNVFLWNQELEKYKTQGLEGFQRDAQKVLDALQAALRNFEGPKQ